MPIATSARSRRRSALPSVTATSTASSSATKPSFAASRRSTRPYASGPCYYLSSIALSAFYEYNVRFPDEIRGEIYEDVFVGRVLREMGITLTHIDFGERGAENVDSNPDWTDHDPDDNLLSIT